MKKNDTKDIILGAGFVIISMIVVIILLTFAVMLLWNRIVPEIILCDRITFWQSLGLVVLVSLLTFDKSKLCWIYE